MISTGKIRYHDNDIKQPKFGTYVKPVLPTICNKRKIKPNYLEGINCFKGTNNRYDGANYAILIQGCIIIAYAAPCPYPEEVQVIFVETTRLSTMKNIK